MCYMVADRVADGGLSATLSATVQWRKYQRVMAIFCAWLQMADKNENIFCDRLYGMQLRLGDRSIKAW